MNLECAESVCHCRWTKYSPVSHSTMTCMRTILACFGSLSSLVPSSMHHFRGVFQLFSTQLWKPLPVDHRYNPFDPLASSHEESNETGDRDSMERREVLAAPNSILTSFLFGLSFWNTPKGANAKMVQTIDVETIGDTETDPSVGNALLSSF